MALPDYLRHVTGTQIVVADSTDYTSPSDGKPARTDQIDLTNLADGSLRQSDKLDFGASRGMIWQARACIEFFSAPSAEEAVHFFLGFSSSGTAGNDNPANLSGSDGAFNGYGGAAADGREAVKQLIHIGTLVTTADADMQYADLGEFITPLRYGCLVVWNDSGVALAATNADETCVILTPVGTELQDT